MSLRVSDTPRKLPANDFSKGGYEKPSYKIGWIILDLGPMPPLGGRGPGRENSRVYPLLASTQGGLNDIVERRAAAGGTSYRPIGCPNKSVSEARMNHTGHAWSSIVRPSMFVWIRRGGLSHSVAGAGVGAATPNLRLRLAS